MTRPEQAMETLTDREWDILRGISQGLSNVEIAEQFSISATTVKWYARQIYSKLQLQEHPDKRKAAAAIVEQATARENAFPAPNLPADVLPFVGREDDIRALSQLLHVRLPRLISLVGIGGVGKSRLALHIARFMLPVFEERVYLVRLQALRTPDDLLLALAQTVGSSTSGHDLLATIAAHIGQYRMLLVLDNAEHLVPHMPVVLTLLERAPRLQLLVTSRVRLGLNSEAVYPMSGLKYPSDAGDDDDPLSYDAVTYFVQMGQQVNLHWYPTEADLQHVVRICHLVDGLPLALNLAARRLLYAPLADITRQVESAIHLLTVDSPDVPDRQRSVETVIQAMTADLPPADSQQFAHLGLFAGVFDLSVAQTVAGISELTMGRFIQRGLVEIVQPGQGKLHPLVQRYALAQLQASDLYPAAVQRFLAYYRELAVELEPHLVSDTEALDALERQWPHLLAAWRYAFEMRDWDSLQSMLLPLHLLAWRRSLFYAAVDAFEEVLTSADIGAADPRFALELETRYGHLKGNISPGAETHRLQHIADQLFALGAPEPAAFALLEVGLQQRENGQIHMALQTGHRALDTYILCEDTWGMAAAHYQLGIVEHLLGDDTAAQSHWRQCRHLNEDVGDIMLAAMVLHRQAWMAWHNGDSETALNLLNEALSVKGISQDREMIGGLTQLASVVCFGLGDYDSAARHRESSLAYYRWAQNQGIVRYLLSQKFYEALLANDLNEARSILTQMGSTAEAEQDPIVLTCRAYLQFVTADSLPAPASLLDHIAQLQALGAEVQALITATLLLPHMAQHHNYRQTQQVAAALEGAPLSPRWLLQLPGASRALAVIEQHHDATALIESQSGASRSPETNWQQKLADIFGV